MSVTNCRTHTGKTEHLPLVCYKKCVLFTAGQEISHLNFDDTYVFTDTNYKSLMGLSKDNFHTVCDSVKDYGKETQSKSLQKSVAVFLCNKRLDYQSKFCQQYFTLQNRL